MTALLDRVQRDLERAGRRARNGIRHLSEVGRPLPWSTPREPVWRRDKVQLWRFSSARRTSGPPVLLVMSLVTRPYVFDLRPGSSFVERLLEHGHDVFLLDWGVPDAVESGNTLETYCDDYLPRAATEVCRAAGADGVTVVGYCLGGVLSLLYAAGHADAPLRNLVVLATPIDFSTFGALGALFGSGRIEPDDLLDETGNVPATTMLNGIKLLKPTGDVLGVANLLVRLHDMRYVEAHESLIGWSLDHIPFPGAAFRQVVDAFFRRRCLVEGRVPIGDRVVDLRDISCPVLSVTGSVDHLVPPACSDPLAGVLAARPLDQLRFPTGHVGLFIGRQANATHIPRILDWVAAHQY